MKTVLNSICGQTRIRSGSREEYGQQREEAHTALSMAGGGQPRGERPRPNLPLSTFLPVPSAHPRLPRITMLLSHFILINTQNSL